MESLFIEIAKSSPTSIVSLVFLYMFLKYLKERDDSIADLNSKRDETAARICAALDRNSDSLSRCEAAHERVERMMQDKREGGG